MAHQLGYGGHSSLPSPEGTAGRLDGMAAPCPHATAACCRPTLAASWRRQQNLSAPDDHWLHFGSHVRLARARRTVTRISSNGHEMSRRPFTGRRENDRQNVRPRPSLCLGLGTGRRATLRSGFPASQCIKSNLRWIAGDGSQRAQTLRQADRHQATPINESRLLTRTDYTFEK